LYLKKIFTQKKGIWKSFLKNENRPYFLDGRPEDLLKKQSSSP
jgi:hypothetical protein